MRVTFLRQKYVLFPFLFILCKESSTKVSGNIKKNLFCFENYFSNRSPNLTSVDYFLLSYVKEKVIATTLAMKKDIKRWIQTACKSIIPIMLSNIGKAIITRIDACFQSIIYFFWYLSTASRNSPYVRYFPL